MENFMNDNRVTLNITGSGHIPTYSNEFAAGLDLKVKTDETIILKHGDHAKIKTGICVEIPHGYFGLIAVRSGLGARGLVLSNAVGIIDEDYRGEIMIPIYNHGDDVFELNNGERIAQMILIPYVQGKIKVVESLSETERGKGGFGSSGRF